MGSVASELKTEREKRKISLAQIAADTRISLRYLESLEEGRYGDLPGGMYNRAFLRAYCESLNLDQREIIRRYEAEVSPLSEKAVRSKARIPPQSSSLALSPLFVWSVMLLISATGLLLNRKWITAVFSQYFSHTPAGSVRFVAQPKPPPAGLHAAAPSAPPPSPSPPATRVTSQKGPVQGAPVAPGKELPSSLPASASPLRLEILATETCWISINRDGSHALSKLLDPGEVQSLDAAEKFFIVVGNASGVHLKINGRSAKPLGKQGEVIKLLINRKNLPDLFDHTAG
jgi:cytoskeletal protein RodZ